jgi:hypothetical protein
VHSSPPKSGQVAVLLCCTPQESTYVAVLPLRVSGDPTYRAQRTDSHEYGNHGRSGHDWGSTGREFFGNRADSDPAVVATLPNQSEVATQHV